jgi:hypothetical protein
MANSQPNQAELEMPPLAEAGERQSLKALALDYVMVFRMMSPSFSGSALSQLQCGRLLPVTTGVQFFWLVIFFIVELSGGAGGTSGVAGARTVLLFFIYLFFLIPIALLISRAAVAGRLQNSGLVHSACSCCSKLLMHTYRPPWMHP